MGFIRKLVRSGGSEAGFTLVEMILVIVIMAIILGVVTVLYFNASRDSAVRAAQEMLKTDLRKSFSLTDSGIRSMNDVRDRYRITIHDNTYSDGTQNCWRIEKGVCTGAPSTFTYTDVVPAKAEAKELVSIGGHTWIKPSSEGDVQIEFPSLPGVHEYVITFVSKGSIMTIETNPVGSGDRTIRVKSSSNNLGRNIIVNDYGDIN